MEAEALKRENLLAVEIQQSYCETYTFMNFDEGIEEIIKLV